MENIVYYIAENLFSHFCHQENNLLMMIEGEQLPLCIRCSFIYLGIFSSYLLALFSESPPLSWKAGFLLVTILAVEWLSANLGLHSSTAFSRGLVGYLGGIGLYSMVKQWGDLMNIWPTVVLILLASAAIAVSNSTGLLALIILTWLLFWTDIIVTIASLAIEYLKKGETK